MAATTVHSDQIYIEGLANNDSEVIHAIYKKFVPKVVHYIKSNSGDADKAQDVVQEVLILLFNQAKAQQLQLTCPFDAYFFLLCKRKWLNELKKHSNKGVTIKDEQPSIHDAADEMVVQTEHFDEKQQLYDAMFQKLGEKCQELIKLSFELPSMEQVAEKLAVTYGYVRKKKSLCIGQLTQLIQENNRFKSIKNT
ncbi:RNA polymerase sigma factor [Flavobacterium aquicola]|uniref:RNA polymerase sigma factor (Sigma-70 family) n=1 Tax=Flavobacterium aquicola TaxID=1682742 RepID=A0A3E0EH63_9FLAO|nr:sigma-70 family RNA polymerase sigma factor [Flavobacterium aquicola]REG96366.1 RNA polymerase sigma factor (sigma-70 family) [Flavobacterium aquicola]